MQWRDYTMADMKDQAKDAIEEGASKVKKATDTVGGKADETLSHVRNWAEPVLDQAQASYRQVAGQAHDGLRHAEQFVSGNPMPSVAAVFGVGIAVGIVIGISMGSRRY
jgi:ElaB/YqjD/DUF883 family membrane-anchored ribosome-binding protein